MIYKDNSFEIIKSIDTAKAYKIVYSNNEFIKQELFENEEYTIQIKELVKKWKKQIQN